MPKQRRIRSKLQNSTSKRIDNYSSEFSNRYGELSTITQDDIQSLSRYSISSEDDDDKIDVGQHVLDFLKKQLIFSRIFMIVYQFAINKIMNDAHTDAFKGIPKNENSTRKDIVYELFSGLARWDSIHFLHIADELAFFPLFPAVLRISGTFFQTIFGSLAFNSAMILGGVLINNILFVLTGMILFRLVLKLTGNLKESIISVYIFCWNPASVFFSSLYTESLYSFITFGGMLFLQMEPTSKIRHVITSCIFAWSFFTRSNGLLNIGYIWFYLGLELILKKTDDRLEFDELNFLWIKKILNKLPYFLFCLLIILFPLRIWSFAMEEKFCQTIANYKDPVLLEYAQNNSHILPGNLENLTWCNADRDLAILMPSYYQHVQEKYWGVELFGYWEFRKIPLFILAAPTIGFIFYGAFDLLFDMALDARRMEEIIVDRRMLIPYTVHSLLISLLGIFFYNVEVSIRMLYSSSPYIYIVIARIISRQTPRVSVPDDMLEPYVLPFLSIYGMVRPLHFLMLSYLLGFWFIDLRKRFVNQFPVTHHFARVSRKPRETRDFSFLLYIRFVKSYYLIIKSWDA